MWFVVDCGIEGEDDWFLVGGVVMWEIYMCVLYVGGVDGWE